MEIELSPQPGKTIYGLWASSSDKTIAKDIPTLSGRFYKTLQKEPGAILPFYVLTKDYDQATGSFRLLIGCEEQAEGLEAFQLADSAYARVTVKPKLGFLWGPAIGGAKRYVYAKWLPASGYEALSLEYEYHTVKSTGRNPEIDLFFALKPK